MTDEEYIFRTECAEKKRTARGSFNRLSHAGKGGRVKMPSDYMTKKERDKMNGEVQSYNLNSPMKWMQFKRMPDDIQRERKQSRKLHRRQQKRSPRRNRRGAEAPESGMLVFSDTTAQDAFNAAYALLTTVSMRRVVISWEAAHE